MRITLFRKPLITRESDKTLCHLIGEILRRAGNKARMVASFSCFQFRTLLWKDGWTIPCSPSFLSKSGFPNWTVREDPNRPMCPRASATPRATYWSDGLYAQTLLSVSPDQDSPSRGISCTPRWMAPLVWPKDSIGGYTFLQRSEVPISYHVARTIDPVRS